MRARPCHPGRFLAVAVLALLTVLPVLAFQPRQEIQDFDHLTRPEPSALIGIRAVGISTLDQTDPLRQGWEGFQSEQSAAWKVWLDERSGLPSLAYGTGIAWVPGPGNDLELTGAVTLETLEALARDFLEKHETLLGRWDGQMILDREASGQVAGRTWQVVFRQVVDGVPVESSRFDLQVVQGNLVAFGATRWAPVQRGATPRLDRETARVHLIDYLENALPENAEFRDEGSLSLVPFDPGGVPGSSWEGARGTGYGHLLTWGFVFTVPGEPATWVARVDADTGEVVALYDDTRYERIKGGVFPLTDDGNGPDGTDQPGFPMPFADYSVDGGSDIITGDHGLYQCDNLGATIATNLVGPYVRISDQCGSFAQDTICDEELDLGYQTGINCSVASGDSPGNTGAARNSFYHVNKIKKLARAWLPGNTWLQGQLNVRTNVNSSCNATYNGNLNMYRDGGNCRNTGENVGVLVHEWGHGMDANDGGGYDNPSEAYADVVAALDSRISCIGPGFFKTGTCSGYGDTCLECTGIRDLDWDMRQDHTPATPSVFEANYCDSGGSPCGKETHCASYVPAEAVYDLATRDLPAMGIDADSAWQLAERLFYTSRVGSGGNAFNCSLPNSDGCGTVSWFHKFRVADDDDGNLANGTPHAAAIFAAFDRHDIACGNSTDTDNQNNSSCPVLAAPAVTLTARSNAVQLDWAEVPDAASYRILRNELGCHRSQGIVEDVAAPALTYLDDELANDFDVYYRVQAIGSNAACLSPVSECLSATPQLFAGSVRFDHQTFGCSNRIGLQVRDANVGSSTVTVTIWSETETAPETVVLTESEPGSNKYLGEIYTTGAAPGSDGLLSTTHGDTITVQYLDADDGAGGTGIPVQRAALSDCASPLISGVAETGVTDSQATITWLTDEGSDSMVVWSEAPPPDQVASQGTMVTTHAVPLSGLLSCTVYYYQVQSTDPAGNTAVSDMGGQYYRFETLGDFGSGLQPCHAGRVGIDLPVYSCSDTIWFELVDIDLNADAGVADTVAIEITSTTETDPEVLVLTETGVNTSMFRGSIATTGGAPQPDGTLQTEDGGVITATYHDQDDGTGLPAVSFVTADLDCGGPEITDLRLDTFTNARATVRFSTSEPGNTVVEWGATPSLGETITVSGLRTTHAVVLNQFDSCGRGYLRVSSTDGYGNTGATDLNGEPYAFDTWLIPGLYWWDNLEGDTSGWTLQGEWEVGEPQGLGGSSGQSDPTEAYNNSRVLGNDLSGQGAYAGDYEPSTNEVASTEMMNASSWNNTKLILHRRLNVGSTDSATIIVWRGMGTPIWGNQNATITDSAYSQMSFDISALADGQPLLAIQFALQSDGSGQYSGWNIDDVILKDGSLPDYDACGGCGSAPSFSGAASAVDTDGCGGTGVVVSWARAVAWGSGGGGTYAVYRDTSPGFVPSGSNLIAAGITTLTYTDLSAPQDQTLYYLVRAENDEGCSTGPNNSGVTDGNEVYVLARDDTSQPIPGGLNDSLLLGKINDAHLRLTWEAATDAVTYHVHRSISPEPGSFGQIADTAGLLFDDPGQVGDAVTYFYLVQGANSCGQEGP